MIHHKYWLRILPLLFLAATFEHCYAILSLYGGGLLLPALTTILLVLAIDSSIYFSMQFIEIVPARIILILSGIISVSLNIKYMLDWKPSGTFGWIIAAIVGALIPLMLCLFGWLQKEVSAKYSIGGSNGMAKLRNVVQFYLLKFPERSNRQVAELFECSHTTVKRYRDELNGKE